MSQIVANGKFVIPLYHGTSSIFLESVQDFGLGSVNPIEQFNVLPFMRHLFDLTETSRRNDFEWTESKYFLEWMLDQSVLDGGANFQHGQSYLTPSRSSAVGYALSNRFGSELLSQTYSLFAWLKENRPNIVDEMRLTRHPVVKIFGCSASPVLVTAHRVKVSQVVAENGGDAGEIIDQLDQFLGISGEPAEKFLKRSDFTLNLNFRLIAPVKPQDLEVTHLHRHDEVNPYR